MVNKSTFSPFLAAWLPLILFGSLASFCYVMLNDRNKKNLLLYHFIVFLYGFTSILGALISLEALPIVIYRMLIGALGLAIFFLLLTPPILGLIKNFLKKFFFLE